ncbi:hypothetical protein V8C86DRAFT_3115302 [Haematococcus lacustris]
MPKPAAASSRGGLAHLKLFRTVPPAGQSFFSVLAEPLWYTAQVRLNQAARDAAAEQDPTGQQPLGAFRVEEGAAWEPAAVARLNKPSYRLTLEEQATHLHPLPAQPHEAQEQAQGACPRPSREERFKGKDPELDAAHFDQLWPKASQRLQAHVAALAHLKLFRTVPPAGQSFFSVLAEPLWYTAQEGAAWEPAAVARLNKPSYRLTLEEQATHLHPLPAQPHEAQEQAQGGVRPPGAAGDPEVTAVADGAPRGMEHMWEASAQQVAGQGAAGERE